MNESLEKNIIKGVFKAKCQQVSLLYIDLNVSYQQICLQNASQTPVAGQIPLGREPLLSKTHRPTSSVFWGLVA